jgi:hypothetical protein
MIYELVMRGMKGDFKCHCDCHVWMHYEMDE